MFAQADTLTLSNRFLWVKLQLDNLCQVSEVQQDDAVEKALYMLPL
jgi:hypothetical protein